VSTPAPGARPALTGARAGCHASPLARSAPTHAKLARPASVALVPRPRLFARLDRGPAVTWLCGPPGSGKSALAAS